MVSVWHSSWECTAYGKLCLRSNCRMLCPSLPRIATLPRAWKHLPIFIRCEQIMSLQLLIWWARLVIGKVYDLLALHNDREHRPQTAHGQFCTCIMSRALLSSARTIYKLACDCNAVYKLTCGFNAVYSLTCGCNAVYLLTCACSALINLRLQHSLWISLWLQCSLISYPVAAMNRMKVHCGWSSNGLISRRNIVMSHESWNFNLKIPKEKTIMKSIMLSLSRGGQYYNLYI